MEIKAELLKPYTEEEKIEFIVEQNHNNGYEIKETEKALEAWGYSEEEKQEQKRERLNLLSMTKREMFLGLYQAKGITPDMLKAQITDGVNDKANSANALSDSEKQKALIEFEYANDYYRGNPLIDIIGGQLGFTSEQLDKFFETKDYHYLTTCTLTVNPTPESSLVVINSEIQKEITVPYGNVVDLVVSNDGYISHADVLTLTEDRILDIELEEEVQDENTADTTEPDISI